ncbi:substrate-binding domain-containing protein [Variovorax sp.]|uniref:substrate-binding domain-containing protein n=1 Tax=Variovorax sp. TaxID=1871043 RepID=UPI0037D9E953
MKPWWILAACIAVTSVALLMAFVWTNFMRTPPNRIVGLILKTEQNPFFVTMKSAAIDAARTRNIQLLTAAGRYDGDTQAQVDAIESMVKAGARTLLVTPNGSAINDAIRKARGEGVMVIALDGTTDPSDVVDGLLATNNYEAGFMIGQYAKAHLSNKRPRIAMIGTDAHAVGVARHNGFLAGLGLAGAGPALAYLATPPEVACVGNSLGDRARGRAAMAQCLRSAPDINLVYTINEPTAAGVHEALKSTGKANDAMIVSIDGGCQGVRDVGAGIIAATAQQYPAMMAVYGLDAADTYARTGRKVTGNTDTGVNLITEKREPGDKSMTVSWGLANCWGG